MPSLKAIRARINSAKNTQKITRAMKLMSAARLRRAQEAILAARPYAKALEDVIAEVAARAGRDAHPLLVERPARRVLLVAITADRGLAGAFNSQINRAVERYHYEHKPDHEKIDVIVLGRKGRDYLRRRKVNLVNELGGVGNSDAAQGRATELSESIVADYLAEKYDAVFLLYNEFVSAISQKVKLVRLLPIEPKPLPAGATPTDFKYEPTKQDVLDRILPMYARVEIYRALLESIASEFGARMSAMDNASNNAKEMIGRLTLDYNRARQAAITKELLEIIGGAEALKG
jgi:F-type H+-transporting ATPase subunit gamma